MRVALWSTLLHLVLIPSAHAAESVTGTYRMENGEVLVQQTRDGRIKFPSMRHTRRMSERCQARFR